MLIDRLMSSMRTQAGEAVVYQEKSMRTHMTRPVAAVALLPTVAITPAAADDVRESNAIVPGMATHTAAKGACGVAPFAV
jgi:hypothetical protein